MVTGIKIPGNTLVLKTKPQTEDSKARQPFLTTEEFLANIPAHTQVILDGSASINITNCFLPLTTSSRAHHYFT